jgi:hypothetical protein
VVLPLPTEDKLLNGALEDTSLASTRSSLHFTTAQKLKDADKLLGIEGRWLRSSSRGADKEEAARIARAASISVTWRRQHL